MGEAYNGVVSICLNLFCYNMDQKHLIRKIQKRAEFQKTVQADINEKKKKKRKLETLQPESAIGEAPAEPVAPLGLKKKKKKQKLEGKKEEKKTAVVEETEEKEEDDED